MKVIDSADFRTALRVTEVEGKNVDILSTMVQLAAAFVVGFYYGRRKVFTEDTNARLSRFVVNAAMPAMILSILNKIDPAAAEAHGSLVWKIFIFGFLMYAAVLILSFPLGALLDAPQGCRRVARSGIIFSNMGLIGFPIMNAFLGPMAVFYNTPLVIHFNLFFYSVGIYFAEKDAGLKTKLQWRSFINPGLIACVIGLVMFLTGWRLPDVVHKGVDFIGSIATPLSIVIIGASLGLADLKKMFNQRVYYRIAAMRLILIPLLTFLAAYFVLKDYIAVGTVVLGAATPIASSVVMSSADKPVQNEFSAQMVGLSTLLSVLTIPAWALILKAVYA
ncbi:MAG: AEC family transporter [Saccharofermentanales bacterium]